MWMKTAKPAPADVFTMPLKKLDDYTSERFDEFRKILWFRTRKISEITVSKKYIIQTISKHECQKYIYIY